MLALLIQAGFGKRKRRCSDILGTNAMQFNVSCESEVFCSKRRMFKGGRVRWAGIAALVEASALTMPQSKLARMREGPLEPLKDY